MLVIDTEADRGAQQQAAELLLRQSDEYAAGGNLLMAHGKASGAYSALREGFRGDPRDAELVAEAASRCIISAAQLDFSIVIPVIWVDEVAPLLDYRARTAFLPRAQVYAAGASALAIYHRRSPLDREYSWRLRDWPIISEFLVRHAAEAAWR